MCASSGGSNCGIFLYRDIVWKSVTISLEVTGEATPQSGNQVSTPLGNRGLRWTFFARNRDTADCSVCRKKWRLTDTGLKLSNPVPWQNWMAAYLAYTLRMKTLFHGWWVMVHDMHTRRRRRLLRLGHQWRYYSCWVCGTRNACVNAYKPTQCVHIYPCDVGTYVNSYNFKYFEDVDVIEVIFTWPSGVLEETKWFLLF